MTCNNLVDKIYPLKFIALLALGPLQMKKMIAQKKPSRGCSLHNMTNPRFVDLSLRPRMPLMTGLLREISEG